MIRKIIGGQSRSQTEAAALSPESSLGLMHLRKLFTEFRHPSQGATQKEQEFKLYNMLPLFCKVFGSSPTSTMTDKFGDILAFCSHVSRLMVTEIRRRASNQTTDAASCAIVKFLEIESTEETSNGWMLLSSINLLSSGTQAIIDCMTAVWLPSTLVKCLYLFFDLPEVGDANKMDAGSEFTPNERRVLLQKVLVQVLVKLCSHSSPAEELARKDDLSLLFNAITSWCPSHNVAWRKSSAEVLVTLSRHGLTSNVVKYIHDKGCVRQCLDNMQRVQELSPIELVEMFVTVFCFLKDSSEVSQIILDDFKMCQGYIFLSEFLLRFEQNNSEEAQHALRNLVLLVGSLTTCGFTEIKPSQASTGSLYQMPGFVLPQPSGKGISVRNIQAFQVLQSVFLKATSAPLCSTILDVISSIYHQDNSNYFILEPQHTLSQFAEKIYLKPMAIQSKFFDLLEFIVFNLNFVPCKELISLSILIKTQKSVPCSILCLKCLLNVLRHHLVYKDVFREVGILEVMVTCLHRYAALLKEPQNGTERDKVSADQEELGFLVMEGLSVLLNGNSSNASVFRECGGARCAHNMVPYADCRQQALNIVQQLVLSPGGDDDMGTLLGLMHTAPVMALELKAHILKSLLNVLKESHRTRTVFRKVGGFVYIMSVLVSMEGCLADPPKSPWTSVCRKDIMRMLRTVFSTLTVAMRYEPANAKFFATEVRYDSLTEAVRLLGCFSNTINIQPIPDSVKPSDNQLVYENFFLHPKDNIQSGDVPVVLLSACLMIRYLYDMAIDSFDRPTSSQHQASSSVGSRKHLSSVSDDSSPHASPLLFKRNSTGSINLNLTPNVDPVIVHAGAVTSIFHLLPAIECEENPRLSLDLRSYTAEVLKSLLRTERNQQVMCMAAFPHELLSHGSGALANEADYLHPPLQYMFERLAAQSLTSRDLRDFLRLSCPLNCRPVDDLFEEENETVSNDSAFANSKNDKHTVNSNNAEVKTTGDSVPLTRVKCLVSMTTPRDARMHGANVTPAFVEFDMNAEGFGCLYLPSIAPQGPPTPSVVGGVVGSSEQVVYGGVGTGERMFPPQSGLTYSTWICVDKFSNAAIDPHPVRLLTIVRNLQGREDNLICLNVTLMSRDRALLVSTAETFMPTTGSDQEQDPVLNDNTVRFWCPELTQEGQWLHLVLIFHRAGIMKNSSVSLFMNGDHINTQKLHYISPNVGGGGTASPTAFTSVFSYIGTPPQLRRQSKLTWRQGPGYLLEDIVSSTMVKTLFTLGPTYVGSFQSPQLEDSDVSSPLVVEDKMIFGVHAHAMSQMTVAKIRKVYNKVDSKSIAKQLAMSAHENATPIRILHNSAGHLSGPARSLGAILMGYLGVRTFCPKPVAMMLENIGGTSALLGLIAMVTDVEGLYAAVKALVCVVRSNKSAMRDMDRIRGYQTLAMLYKKKRHLLNKHILHLTFSLVGTVDSGRESTIIPNKSAFLDLLCDLEVWHESPGDLQRSLYEHFYELLTESGEKKINVSVMRDFNLTNQLLHIFKDQHLSTSTIQTIASVLTILLEGVPDPQGLLRLGQFVVSTISAPAYKEGSISLSGSVGHSPDTGRAATDDQIDSSAFSGAPTAYKIKLRNTCLDIILKLIMHPKLANINQPMCEEIQKVLGYDWLLLLMQSHIHQSTVISALRILINMLSNGNNMQRFRDGSCGGGWLHDTETILKNQLSAFLGFNIGSANNKNQRRTLNLDVCHVPGFQALQWLLPAHTNVPEVYFLLMALLLGQQVKVLPEDVQLNLDAVWPVIFGVPATTPVAAKDNKVELCPDAAIVILAMIRSMLNQPDDGGPSLQEYPVTLMQFFLFLYRNQISFVSQFMSGDFIIALASSLFPYKQTEVSSDYSSPSEEFKPFPEAESIVIINSPVKVNGSYLTTHTARKFVIDMLKTIVIDSFANAMHSKCATVVDLMLEACPEHSVRCQQVEYQTEMLQTLMEHLLAADVLLGEQAALPMPIGGSYANMAANVFYFTSRVVDKLWQGVFVRESKEVFDFVSSLISQAKRKASGLSLDPIYKCLNRTMLFQLSRQLDSVASQTTVLEALHKLTSNRSLVFGPGNYDQEFMGCLCFCLLHLTDNRGSISPVSSETKTTTWHLTHSPGELPGDGQEVNPSMREGHQLVANAAKRVWEELYICKKPVLEEIFHTTLNNIDLTNSSLITSPDLDGVRPIIKDASYKLWMYYSENERKSSLLQGEKIPTQIQSKLQKVGSGVLRLYKGKSKKELPLKSSPASTVHASDYTLWQQIHASIVRDLVEFQYKQYLQNAEHLERYLYQKWTQTEKELLRERGLWGPPVGSRLDKWILDMTEGPCRMRKKMLDNDMFYSHYPYRPDSDPDKPPKHKVAICNDSKDYYQCYRSQSLLFEAGPPILTDEDGESPSTEADGHEEKSPDLDLNMPKLLAKRFGTKPSTDTEEDPDDVSSTDMNPDADKTENPNDSQSENQAVLMRLLGEGEKISHMFRCARIQGLDTAEGLLLFGKEHFYVVDGFTILTTKEIKDIDSLPPELHDPIIPRTKGTISTHKQMCSKFAYDDIREVHKRRYLLQDIAVEVFSSDGSNYLLAFPRKSRNRVYTKLMSVATTTTDNAQQSKSGQSKNAKVEPGTGLISTFIGEKSVTQRWERGEINNFQYLMHVNTLAGRSYNDLMQYPVFPWILADYDSDELDLTNKATFRDFSKPMGAQTPDRLKQFNKRYNDWDDPQGETPPYHYGTHYSSAMIVASYLVRMEPFTQHFLKLQGGHFDLADRMFNSVKENWLSASKHNMADVKELIPEFFYLPEFLMNSNNFDLGCKQSGVWLGDALLPVWAKGDPGEFIRVHREALECDFVSAHLHEWIDLIFGYKQHGPAAVDAVNMFHHLFYEGNVDIYNIDDPLKKNATIGFINNFGQIPKQLFKKPHPQKKLNIRSVDSAGMSAVGSMEDRLFFHNVDNLKPTKSPIKELKGSVGQIINTDKYVLAVEQNKVLMPPAFNRYLAWGFSDLSVRMGVYESDKATAVFECLDNGEIFCAACPSAKIFITGGTSCVVNVWEYKVKEKRTVLKQPLYGHTEPVICMAASPAFNIVVSGSRDRTCIIWDMGRLVFMRQLQGHSAPVAAVCINEMTGDIATCAGTYLHVWTINGVEIACVNTATAQNHQILCVCMSQLMEWDTRNVILTGSSDGVVRMWSVEFVQLPDENQKQKDNQTNSGNKAGGSPSKPINIPKISRKESCDSYSDLVVDRLKDFKDPECLVTLTTEPELGSSAESDNHLIEHMRNKSRMLNADIGLLSRGHALESVDNYMREGSSSSDIYKADDNASIDGDHLLSNHTGDRRQFENDSQRTNDATSGKSIDAGLDALLVLDDSSLNLLATASRSDFCLSENNGDGLTEALNSERCASQPELNMGGSEGDGAISPSSDFVVISEADLEPKKVPKEELFKKSKAKSRHSLREGFKWQRQLVFRSKLTMHTAFERKDNKDPSPVTCIAISRDHKTVYVGDAKGRIFNWTVTDQPGRVVADHWIMDDGADSCLHCGVKFSFSERRHHCRNCGQMFCSKCSRGESEIRHRKIIRPVRVCIPCYKLLQQTNNGASKVSV